MKLKIPLINQTFYGKKLNPEKEKRARDLERLNIPFATKKLQKQVVEDEESFNALVDFMWRNPELMSQIQNGAYKFYKIGLRTDLNGKDWNLVNLKSALNEDNRGKRIQFVQIGSSDYSFPLERAELDGANSFAFYNASLPAFLTSADYNLMLEQIQIVKNKNGEPEKVICKRMSNVIRGFYDTTEYNLSDYPENYNVLKAIRKGKIEGGKELTKVVRKRGGYEYNEDLKSVSGCSIKRKFISSMEDKREYSIRIFDENSNPILILDRSFEKEGNLSTTVINGKIIETEFYPKNNIATIKSEDAQCIFDYSKKVPSKRLKNLLMKLPADILKNIKEKVDQVKYTYDDCRISKSTIYTDSDPASLYHELGHIISSDQKLTDDEKLKELYQSEYNEFSYKNPFFAQGTFISYFSPLSVSAANGLGELIAETNMLLTTPVDFLDKHTMTRSQLLIQHFPKTIAYIATKLGLNAIEPKF